MFDREEMKNAAKNVLSGRWKTVIAVTLVYILITAAIQVAIYIAFPYRAHHRFTLIYNIASFASIIITAPLQIGFLKYYIKFINTNGEADIEELFSGFNIAGKAILLYFWVLLWTCLWMLLLVIPGLIKYISYSQSFYILAENPEISVRQAMRTSIEMTDGFKLDMFVMYLSFIGWLIAAALTLGIGFFWLIPYVTMTLTFMYFELKKNLLYRNKEINQPSI